jgi:signal peptidase I
VVGYPSSKSAATPLRVEVQRPNRSLCREYAEALIVSVVLALVIRTFVVQAFVIPSGSMLPTLRIGDYVLVNKFVYLFRPIRRGDIIVFKFPQDETRDFIKRVVGLPGETLEIRDRQVFIDGKPLHEPYAVYSEPPLLRAPTPYHLAPMVIPPGHLFMMGDNRDNSLDSRAWGLLEEAKVVGEASIVYFSIRSADIPYGALLPRILYTLVHPALMRWDRIGRLVR